MFDNGVALLSVCTVCSVTLLMIDMSHRLNLTCIIYIWTTNIMACAMMTRCCCVSLLLTVNDYGGDIRGTGHSSDVDWLRMLSQRFVPVVAWQLPTMVRRNLIKQYLYLITFLKYFTFPNTLKNTLSISRFLFQDHM